MSKTMSRITFLTLSGVIILLLALFTTKDIQAQSITGTNWSGNFFNCTSPNGCPLAEQGLYPNGIQQDWGVNKPVDGFGNTLTNVNADGFSASFTTTEIFAAGNYEFTITSDDGARMFVDNVLVFDRFIPRPRTTDIFTVTFTEGTHSLRVEYFDNTDTAVIQVAWRLVSDSVGLTSTAATALPTATAIPAAMGSVANVNGLAVRTGPYLGASLITVIRPGTEYEVLARNEREGLFIWYLLRIPRTTSGESNLIVGADIVGWASGRYLAVNVGPEFISELDSNFESIGNPPNIGVIGYTRAIMNMRVRPSVRTPVLLKIPWGDPVEVTGRTVQAGDSFWYQVRYEGQVGWIIASYVSVREADFPVIPVH